MIIMCYDIKVSKIRNNTVSSDILSRDDRGNSTVRDDTEHFGILVLELLTNAKV